MDLYLIPRIVKSYYLYPTINHMMLYGKFKFFSAKIPQLSDIFVKCDCSNQIRIVIPFQ